jgi:hypothetical protein
LPVEGSPLNETDLNFAAFVTAAKKLKDQHPLKLEFHLNGDATEVAQKLANKDYKVGLLNGSNKQRFGSWWEDKIALPAIEENIFRRAGLPLLKIFQIFKTFQGTTEQKIQAAGGRVVTL